MNVYRLGANSSMFSRVWPCSNSNPTMTRPTPCKPRRDAIDRRWVRAEERGEIRRRARRRHERERDEA